MSKNKQTVAELRELSAWILQNDDARDADYALVNRAADELEAADAETPEARAVRQLGDIAAGSGMSLAQAVDLAGAYRRLADAEAERDAALAVIAKVRSATAALDRRVEDSEDISYFWGEAFDTISEIDAILTKATS